MFVDLQNDLQPCGIDKATVEFYDDGTGLSELSPLASPITPESTL